MAFHIWSTFSYQLGITLIYLDIFTMLNRYAEIRYRISEWIMYTHTRLKDDRSLAMKNLARLVCVVILVFLSSTCFAGETEEKNELEHNILEPIITHFKDSSSLSRLSSIKLIDMQKTDGKFQNLDTNALNSKRLIAADKVRQEIGDDQYKKLNTVAAFCKKYVDRPFTGTPEEATKDFLLTFVSVAWQNNFASCNIYARTVILAISFNNLNNVKQGKPL